MRIKQTIFRLSFLHKMKVHKAFFFFKRYIKRKKKGKILKTPQTKIF